MFSKRILLAISICPLISFGLKAQKTYYPSEKKQYKWTGGINVGNILIKGDVNAKKTQVVLGLHLYKPIAKWFGVKFNYASGNAKGLNSFIAENFAKNTAWAPRYAAPVKTSNGPIVYGYMSNNGFTPAPKGDVVYYNFKTVLHSLSISPEFTLPIPFSNPRVGIHFSFGAGLLFYKAKVNTLDNDGSTYATLFKDISTRPYSSSKEILKDLENKMDNTYETKAEEISKSPHFTTNYGYGLSYMFNNRIEVGVEFSSTFIKTDLLDGQRWQEHAYGDAVLSQNFDLVRLSTLRISYTF